MQEAQDLILHHNFIQPLPKSIANQLIESKDTKDKNKHIKNVFKHYPQHEKNSGKDIVMDNDKSHLHWCVQDGMAVLPFSIKIRKGVLELMMGNPSV